MINLDKIFDLICQIQAISNYAYDIHYSARGSFFYSDHLFSERVGDVEEISEVKDDLIETVYLGRGKDAPLSEDISLRVAEITPEVSKDTQTNFKRLRDLIISALVDIEDLKELTRGEEDLIGSLAHILQRHNGLLYRQLDYSDTEVANEKDVDWITVKGNHIPIPKGASEKEKSKAIEDFFANKSNESDDYDSKLKKAKAIYEESKKAVDENQKKIDEIKQKISDESSQKTEKELGKLDYSNRQQWWDKKNQIEKELAESLGLNQLREKAKELLSERKKGELAVNKTIAEKSFYPESISGVKRGSPMSFERADGGSVNPRNSSGERAYSFNCQSCVVAYEARLRGYDVEASPYGSSASKTLSIAGTVAWINPENGEYVKSIQPDDYGVFDGVQYNAKTYRGFLEKTIKEGERYHLSVQWKGKNEGHILTCAKGSNGVFLYDPQTGEKFEGKNVDKFLSKVKFSTKKGGIAANVIPELRRVDNMAFNPEFFDVMRGKDDSR